MKVWKIKWRFMKLMNTQEQLRSARLTDNHEIHGPRVAIWLRETS